MDTSRKGKLEEIIKDAAAKFFLEESAGSALVTITKVTTAPKGDYATIFFTVLPNDKEETVLEFSKRKRSDFREFLMKETRIQRVPFIDFAIDFGEKNRQRIDEIGAGMQ